ncbi:hypothetical protein GCM10018966_028220 [Streptomyces yanii]
MRLGCSERRARAGHHLGEATMTYDDITVHGTVAPGFEGVRDAYAAVLAEDSTEPGSQLAVRVHGRTVVGLWAGDGIDADSRVSWTWTAPSPRTGPSSPREARTR